MKSFTFKIRWMCLAMLMGMIANVFSLDSPIFSKVEVKEGKLVATESITNRTQTLFEDGVVKCACLVLGDRLIYVEMLAPQNKPIEFFLVISDLKSLKILKRRPLEGKDDKGYKYYLWQFSPPEKIEVFKYPLIILSSGRIIDTAIDGYILIYNIETDRVESVMRGQSISISHDKDYPMISASHAIKYRAMEGKEGGGITDPTLYVWKLSLYSPERFKNRYPYLTASWVVFPEFHDMLAEEGLDGYRLLTSPRWAPSTNKLAFLAVESKSNKLFASVLDFTRPEKDIPFTRSDVNLPENHRSNFREIVKNQDTYYYDLQPDNVVADLIWKSDSELNLILKKTAKFTLKLDRKPFAFETMPFGN